jgi:hypothetical protein
VEKQSTTILITAFAILISAIVEARTVGLTNYHASIVLSLSWMNNTNTFIYFLLYVQHKSQRGEGRIEPELVLWIKHIRENLSFQSTFAPLRILHAETATYGTTHRDQRPLRLNLI